jgi:S1-C subfamily serine protease
MSALQAFSSDLAELVARAAPGVVGVERRHGQGSGVVLSPDGYVLTNAHVVGGRDRGPIVIRLSGARVVRGDVVGSDERTDLAVVRADASGLAALPLSERRLRVGEVVVAIGNPLGFERTVTAGVVSALYRALGTRRGEALDGLLQTDVPINPGNSGGPLLDAEGAVVGITTAMLPWARGIGFAVPGHTASWVASVLIHHGEVRRPFLGIACRGEDLEPELALDVGHSRGVRVSEVVNGSPAEAAGLRAGDLLVAAGGQPLQTLDDLVRAMVLGDPFRVNVELVRGEARRSVELAPRPARAAA